MASEIIKGGLASGRSPKSFNQVQLRKGTKVELEHVVRRGSPTARDRRIAREIAMDHLAEHADYYKHLEIAERKMTAKKPPRPIPRLPKYGEVYRKKFTGATIVVRGIRQQNKGDSYHVRVLKGAGLPSNETKRGNVWWKDDIPYIGGNARGTMGWAVKYAKAWLASAAGKKKIAAAEKTTGTKKTAKKKTAKKSSNWWDQTRRGSTRPLSGSTHALTFREQAEARKKKKSTKRNPTLTPRQRVVLKQKQAARKKPWACGLFDRKGRDTGDRGRRRWATKAEASAWARTASTAAVPAGTHWEAVRLGTKRNPTAVAKAKAVMGKRARATRKEEVARAAKKTSKPKAAARHQVAAKQYAKKKVARAAKNKRRLPPGVLSEQAADKKRVGSKYWRANAKSGGYRYLRKTNFAPRALAFLREGTDRYGDTVWKVRLATDALGRRTSHPWLHVYESLKAAMLHAEKQVRAVEGLVTQKRNPPLGSLWRQTPSQVFDGERLPGHWHAQFGPVSVSVLKSGKRYEWEVRRGTRRAAGGSSGTLALAKRAAERKA